MKTLLESPEFRDELPGWLLRGVLCAVSSVGWAVLLGFHTPAEIAGMATGVVAWVLVFAGACAWLLRTPRPEHARWAAALKRAAWIKIGLTVLGWLLWGGTALIRESWTQPFMLFGMVDAFLGMGALWVVAQVAGVGGFEKVAQLDSFGWTALTTVVEGALMALLIAGITLAVLAWWRWGSHARWNVKFSPVRSLD